MDFAVTIAALAVGIAVVGVTRWLELRPRDLGKAPSWIPTTPLMFLGLMTVMLAAGHLLTLWGLHPDRRP